MTDRLAVAVLHGCDELREVHPRFVLWQLAALLDLIEKLPALRQFEDQMNLGLVHNHLLQLDDVLVLQPHPHGYFPAQRFPACRVALDVRAVQHFDRQLLPGGQIDA